MGIIIRQLLETDRDAVHEALTASEVFNEEEVRVALEVLDEGLAGGLEGGYPAFTGLMDDQIGGYVCVGKTPLTAATWHLYWICVHPRAQRTGLGRALQLHAEEFVRSRGGERLVLETSGQPSYQRARRFYEKGGFREAGRIRDFYKANDDCIIYCKELL
jgi:ribosomal protein S18 acetylase RimI-like enzyme